MGHIYAQVIVNNKSTKTDREYTYLIQDSDRENISIGSKVLVPFGKGNKLIEAFVVDINEKLNKNIKNIKAIQKVASNDTFLSKELVELCSWIKEKYMCQFIDALQCVVPSGTSLKSKKKISLNKNYFRDNFQPLECSKRQREIVRILQNQSYITEDNLKTYLEVASVANDLKELAKMNIIIVDEEFKGSTSKILKKIISINHNYRIEDMLNSLSKSANKQIAVLEFLKEEGRVEVAELKKKLNVSGTTINSLVDKGFIQEEMEEKRRDPYEAYTIEPSTPPKLTQEQENIIKKISPLIENDINDKFLIHGVTGSGKTEVYMHLVEDAIKKSKDAIVLVPEIALATQIVERFKARFGDIVAVLHSKLSLGERFDEWQRIRNGEVKVVIGARSGIFAPFSNLGIVIIDEEHEGSYKSEHNPKYNTIEVAEKRCKDNNGILILGSATPSMESYSKAMSGIYKKLEMNKRFNETPLPSIEVVDMRDEINSGNRSVFSDALFKGINETLNNNKQVILFLNRRGHSTFVSCRSCGYVAKCHNCEISLTYHNHSQSLSCHYCGYTCSSPRVCPSCNSKYIKYFGIGTEKLEELTKASFPKAKVARIDLDTTSRKGSMYSLLQRFKEGKIDILVGTQMIAKGLDFPNVNIVGVISADTSLNLPDFRAPERTFQLITQVSGRAGRGDVRGKVVVQTYEPDHYAITTAKNNDFIGFYNQEINLRKEFRYPPFINLVTILFSSEDEVKIKQCSEYFKNMLLKSLYNLKFNKDDLFGPQQAPIPKIKKRYRWQLILKWELVDQKILNDIIKGIKEECLGMKKFNDVLISIDINPYNML